MRRSVLAGGAAGLGAAGFAIYHGQQPSSEVYGPTIHHEPAAGRRIALTYDDGPNRPYTEELLELFARHGAHATFFQIGPYAQQHPELVREVKAAGHAIGNHTWTHPTMSLEERGRAARGAVALPRRGGGRGGHLQRGRRPRADATALRAPPAGHAARPARAGLRPWCSGR